MYPCRPRVRPKRTRFTGRERRHMPRRGILAQGPADFVLELICQGIARRKLDEQDHALVVLVVLPDCQAVCHLGQFLHLSIDLGCPDSHPGWFQHRVRAAVEGNTAGVAVDQDIVAMPPDTRVHIKVRLIIFAPIRIIPEI